MNVNFPIALSVLVAGLYAVVRSSARCVDLLPFSREILFKFKRYYRMCLLVVAILAPLVVQWYIVPRMAVLSFTTPDFPSSEATVIANGLSLGLLMMLSVFAVERGLRSELTDLYVHRDLIDQRSRRRKRVVVAGVLLWSGLLLEGVLAGWINVAAGLLAGMVGYRLYRHFDLQATVPGETARRPKPAERDRIASWYDESGSFPDNTVVYSGDGSRKSVIASGRGSTRLLAIHEDILAELDDESLGVVLAQAEAKRGANFWPLSLAADTVALAVAAGIVAVLVPPGSLWSTDVLPPYSVSTSLRISLVGIGLLVIMNAGAWTARRPTFRADDEIVSRFGVDRVIDAYQQTGDLYFIDPQYIASSESGRYTREPSMEKRIERLRGKHSIEPATESETPLPRFQSDELIRSRTWPAVIGISTGVFVVAAGYYIASLWFGQFPSSVVSTAIAIFAWTGILVGIFEDTNRMRSTSQWPRYRKTLIVATLLPIVNIIVGCWYLWKRRRITLEILDDTSSEA